MIKQHTAHYCLLRAQNVSVNVSFVPEVTTSGTNHSKLSYGGVHNRGTKPHFSQTALGGIDLGGFVFSAK
jgi:hypothetical protein